MARIIGLNGNALISPAGNTLKAPDAGGVTSVNGQVGDVILDTDNITEGVNKYVTAAEKTAWNNEPETRQTAVANLQNQIDAIIARSDVVDVVNVYDRGTDTTITDIVHYDTTALGANDVVKVMQDETHSNAVSYFRWSGTEWSYVGSQGPYETLANKVTSIGSGSTNTQYPSAKAVYDVQTALETEIGSKYTASNASASARGLVKYAQGTFTISANDFTADSTYEDYPFRKAIAVSGCTSDHFADVCFDLASATGGKIAPVCESYNGGFYIYSKEQNAEQITGTYKVTYNA